jgi:hypothetical protein
MVFFSLLLCTHIFHSLFLFSNINFKSKNYWIFFVLDNLMFLDKSQKNKNGNKERLMIDQGFEETSLKFEQQKTKHGCVSH